MAREVTPEEHIQGLFRSREKLVEMRRMLVKRDIMSDRNEGFSERIVIIQNAIEATDRAIQDEHEMLQHLRQQQDEQQEQQERSVA
jgi:hypothetical protein